MYFIKDSILNYEVIFVLRMESTDNFIYLRFIRKAS